MRLLHVLTAVVIAALATPSTAEAACGCIMTLAPGEASVPRPWSERDRIFIGEVLEADTATDGWQNSVTFVTEASWRGAMPDTVTVHLEDYACIPYWAGERYLVMADLQSPGGTAMVAGKCHGFLTVDHPTSLSRLAELGPAPWRAPPFGSRKLDEHAIRIGEAVSRDSAVAKITFGIPWSMRDSLSRFQIADRDWPDSRRGIVALPPGLYQLRLTWKDGIIHESYVSLRCGPKPPGKRCMAFRSFVKPDSSSRAISAP